jgi:hypothetical protein
MARLSVGPSSWATMSESQRQQVIDGFGRYISAIYADRFDSYLGQKLQVTDEQPSAAGVMVHSQIVKAIGEPVLCLSAVWARSISELRYSPRVPHSVPSVLSVMALEGRFWRLSCIR